MGAIDDIRRVMQDVVAPDLKALDAQISALDKKIDMRVDALDKKIDMRVDALEEKLNLTRDLILSEMKLMHSSLSAEMERLQHAIELDRRVEKLENERAAITRSPLEKRRLGLHRP